MKSFQKHAPDPARFREVLGHYPTGVALVTAISAAGDPAGMIVGSFSSVSLDPPLVSFMPMRNSRSFEALRSSPHFTVNVLAHDQEDLCRKFTRRDGDRFAGVSWTPSSNGSPLLPDSVASIDCTFSTVHEAGDHLIVLGEVKALRVHRQANPLMFFQGGYGGFTPQLLLARADSELAEAVAAGHHIRDYLSKLGNDLSCEAVAFARIGREFAPVARSGGARFAETDLQLGERLPIIAPLGDFFVESPHEERDWVPSVVDAKTKAILQNRLITSRKRGWSISLSSEHREKDLHTALLRYAQGQTMPADMREITETISQAASDYAPFNLEPGKTYNVATVAAPLPSSGKTDFVISLTGLPQEAPSAVIQEWTETLLETAPLCSHALLESGFTR